MYVDSLAFEAHVEKHPAVNSAAVIRDGWPRAPGLNLERGEDVDGNSEGKSVLVVEVVLWL